MKLLNSLPSEKAGKKVINHLYIPSVLASQLHPKLIFAYANGVAGVVGKITKFLGQVIDPRPPNVHDKTKKHKVNGITSTESEQKSKPRSEYLYYEVEVERLETEYPESNERSRKWVLPSFNCVCLCALLTISR